MLHTVYYNKLEKEPLHRIHTNIESFKKRFYQRDLYTGIIITLGGVTALFLLFIISEFIFRFNGALRAVLLYSFLAILSVSSIKNIFFFFF